MDRGEVWLTDLDGPQPVVLLGPADAGGDLPAIWVVAPATPEQKRGFVFLDPEALDNPGTPVGPGEESAITGIEVPLGAAEGLDPAGVVRLALPREGRIFCTWRTTLSAADLLERVGVLSSRKLSQLDAALRLAEPFN